MKSFLDFVWVNNMEDIIYLDSHAHLMSEDYSENLEDVMQRCKEKHIDYIMIITLTKQEALRAIEFKKRDPEHITIAKDTGNTHKAAIAILQSKKNRPIATSVVDMHAPTSSGMK